MIYAWHDTISAALTPARMWAKGASAMMNAPGASAYLAAPSRAAVAWAEVMEDVLRPRGKPEWNIKVRRNAPERVPEQVVLERPFLRLLRFVSPDAVGAPKVLLVAPMSGHHATLLRGTVQDMIDIGLDVYVTDWRDARIVPLLHGDFDLSSYIETIVEILQHLGSETHVVAVCQPAPAVIAAVSLLASRQDPAQPRTMTLMGGPVDTRAAPTVVTKLAAQHSIQWFETHVVATVPPWHPGAFRRVYPGFLQLAAFISMNPDRHVEAHRRMFNHLIKGDEDSAAAHRRFYDEYLAVMDVPASYYLQTVESFFQKHELTTGHLTVRGEAVVPSAIERTALLTIEGELDDISAPGQTIAAHTICSSIPSSRRGQYLQTGVGHYGIFNGRKWRSDILPRIKAFIEANDRVTSSGVGALKEAASAYG
ncbi:MAG: polyhydroxyalkanoate depolymerase [Acetobacteraceae bacterium]|nr:polyhydroxyalkanoate depolymerase [Acetobacteraceae bacterium]